MDISNQAKLTHSLSSQNVFRQNRYREGNLIVWCWRMHWEQREEVPRVLEKEEYRHLRVLRFRSPSETEEWVGSL